MNDFDKYKQLNHKNMIICLVEYKEDKSGVSVRQGDFWFEQLSDDIYL